MFARREQKLVAGTAWKVGNSEYTCMCLSRTFGTLTMSRSMKAMLRASNSLPHKRQACRQIKLTQIGKLKSKETVEPRGVPKDSEICMCMHGGPGRKNPPQVVLQSYVTTPSTEAEAPIPFHPISVASTGREYNLYFRIN